MPNVYGPADQPLMTEDSVLAFALYLAFTPFCDDEMPCVNHYTIDQLRKMGFKGVKPTDAALHATATGRKGTISYLFKQPKEALVAAYNDQLGVIEKSGGETRQIIKNLLADLGAGARSYEETIVRMVATMLYMRTEFLKMWQLHSPLLRVDESGRAQRRELGNGAYEMTHPGFKFVGAKAGEETLKHLQLC